MEKDVDVAVAAGLDSEPLLKVPWAKVREVLAKVPWTKLGISVTVIALIVLVLQKRIELQNAVVALVVVAALPWLGAVLNEVEFGGTTIKFREIREKVDEQGKLLHDLVKYVMAQSIFNHLVGIACYNEYKYDNNEAMRREMYHLRDANLIEKIGRGFADFNESIHGENLVKIVRPTPTGFAYVHLRVEDALEKLRLGRETQNLNRFGEELLQEMPQEARWTT